LKGGAGAARERSRGDLPDWQLEGFGLGDRKIAGQQGTASRGGGAYGAGAAVLVVGLSGCHEAPLRNLAESGTSQHGAPPIGRPPIGRARGGLEWLVGRRQKSPDALGTGHHRQQLHATLCTLDIRGHLSQRFFEEARPTVGTCLLAARARLVVRVVPRRGSQRRPAPARCASATCSQTRERWRISQCGSAAAARSSLTDTRETTDPSRRRRFHRRRNA
jgi:hypothetical protein